jgi:OOP family OmpA-OmpF porin
MKNFARPALLALLALLITSTGCATMEYPEDCWFCRVPPKGTVVVAKTTAPAPAPARNAPDPCTDRITLYGVDFEFDKAILTGEDKVVLDALVTSLQVCPATNIRIEGHTDSVGNDAYNQGLSERRAAAVVAYLVSEGLDSSTLYSVGLGESSPLADNATDAGRAMNRRVEAAPN